MKKKNRIEDLIKGVIQVINRPGQLVYFENLVDKELVACAKTVASWIAYCPQCKSPNNVEAVDNPDIVLTNGAQRVVCTKCTKSGLHKDWAKSYVELFDIRTFEGHRGKGYAREIIEKIKNLCDVLVTSWPESTPEGREFCQACGMTRNGDWLQWNK